MSNNQATIQAFNPNVAGLLSFILPGMGQMYKGEVFRGMAWLFFVILGYIMLVFPGVILHIICIVNARSGNSQVTDPNAPSPETHVKCPDCRELVIKEAKKCKHCGCALIPQ